jgi:hypothetical protein
MTATAPHRAATSARRPQAALVLVAALLIAAAFVFVVLPRLGLPGTVEQLTVENPHAWRVNVDVTGADRDGWHSLGVLGPASTRVFEAVVDQGDVWTFEFAYAGIAVELTTSSEALETAGWILRVPDDFAAALAAANVPPTPG